MTNGTKEPRAYEDQKLRRPHRLRRARTGNHVRPDKTILNVRFSLATTDRWTDVAGEKKEHTDWHRIVFWDPLADVVAKLVRKGSLVEVEGSMASSTFEKDGVTRTSWGVRGAEFRLFPKAETSVAPPPEESPPPSDDIPL